MVLNSLTWYKKPIDKKKIIDHYPKIKIIQNE